MKKIYLLALFALCMLATSETSAQGIYQYWGLNVAGGTDDQGTLYTTRMDGAGLKVRPAFPVTTPGSPGFNTSGVVYNNKIYTIAGGGLDGAGIILAYDPATNTYEKVFDFYTAGAIQLTGNLVIHNNKMYGVNNGYSNGETSFIFEFDPVAKTMIRKFEFPASGFDSPYPSILLWGDEIWATTFVSPNGYGGIYSYDLGSGTYTERYEFTTSLMARRAYCMLAVFNNKIYGTAEIGGTSDKGTLYEYNPATDILTVRAMFSGGNGGAQPVNGLTLFNNKFYGQTAEEGANGQGTLFEFDPVNNLFTTKIQYTDVLGTSNKNPFTVYNNKLYCASTYGGTGNNGTILEYDPATNTLLKKVDCGDNADEIDCALTLYNGKMYGTCKGGPYDAVGGGAIFEYNPDINSLMPKIFLRENQGMVPAGAPTYYNGKMYGLTKRGSNIDNEGVLWEYDMATHAYSVRHNFTNNETTTFVQGMTTYNGKLYGVTDRGGTFDDGTLFSFDPATGIYTTLHSFEGNVDGGSPRARLLVYNNKLYGTCAELGGANAFGTIWEYTPASNSFSLKVKMPPSVGGNPIAGLTELNGKLYGVCFLGGANNTGTIYEYNPAINGILKRFDFTANGGFVYGGMVAVNNKLYGLTTGGDHLYEFNPANGVYTQKAYLGNVGSYDPRSSLVYNEETQKFHATTWVAGSSSGTIFEYDLANNILDKKIDFDTYTGHSPDHMKLEKAPALVAPGTPGNCIPGGSANIDATNNNIWVPFINSNGDAVAEINANGNNLGRVLVNLYVHDGATRQKNGNYYLDRNITITVDNQPSTPVSVRLYIRKTEFEKLKNTPGSGINNIGSLSVFKNDDACSNTMTGSATKLTTNITSWGGDYVFITSVNSFSTFYFASSAAVLPIDLLSFTGERQATANKLQWKASCTNDVDFSIERSVDGTNFQQIALVMATQQDCANPFTFLDQNPPVKAYYRLKMMENNGPVKYSNIILLNRNGNDNFTVSIFPNPVVGTHANLQINSAKKMNVPFTISDAMGRIVMQKEVAVQQGVNTYPIPLNNLAAGVYQLVYSDGEKNNVVRFVKN